MPLREQDKHFLWSLYLAVAIIFLWKGIWEGIGGLPVIENPWVTFFIGLVMLTARGMIYKQFDPLGGIEKSANQMMNNIHQHPRKQEFHIRYHDKLSKKQHVIKASDIKRIENNVLVIHDVETKREVFIPIHRVTEVLHHGKSFWKL